MLCFGHLERTEYKVYRDGYCYIDLQEALTSIFSVKCATKIITLTERWVKIKSDAFAWKKEKHTHELSHTSLCPLLPRERQAICRKGMHFQRDLHYQRWLKSNLESLAIPWPGRNKATARRQLGLRTSQRRCRALLMKQDAELQTFCFISQMSFLF